jgi:hypothetical protein
LGRRKAASDEILETSSNLNISKEKLKQQLKRVFQLFNSSTVEKLTTTSKECSSSLTHPLWQN